MLPLEAVLVTDGERPPWPHSMVARRPADNRECRLEFSEEIAGGVRQPLAAGTVDLTAIPRTAAGSCESKHSALRRG